MILPKNFGEYLERNVIRKVSSDMPRARFLISESEKSLRGLRRRLQVMGIDEDNANSIVKDCYDIIMELIRAKLLIDGYKSAGQFAHEGEVAYLQKLGFDDAEISFINELRYFRNSAMYYGKILSVEYAKKVTEVISAVYPKLRNLITKDVQPGAS